MRLIASSSLCSCCCCPAARRARACRRALSICATWRRPSRRTSAMPLRTTSPARPARLRGRRMRAAARGGACAGARRQADLARQQPRTESVRLLPPERAVAAMWRWAHDGKRRRRQALLSQCRQARAVLARLYRRAFAPFGRHRGRSHARSRAAGAAAQSCRLAARRATTDPAPRRPRSARPTIPSTWAPASTASTPRATRARPQSPRSSAARASMLRAAMSAHGFRNYFREWWHYEFTGARGAVRL